MTDTSLPRPTYQSPAAPQLPGSPAPDAAAGNDMSLFWLMLVLGISSMLFGTAVLVWPDVSIRVLAILMGIWLMVVGAARIVSAFVSGRGIGRQMLSGIVGVLLLVGGLACLRDIVKGAAVLAFLVALAWIFSGLAGLVFALQEHGAARVGLLVLAVLSICAGFIFILAPRLSLLSLVITIGISGFVIGVSELIFAYQVRRFAKESTPSVA